MSRDNVRVLPGCETTARGAPQLALIAALEDLLARTRTGEIQCFAGTGITDTMCRVTITGGHADNVWALRGAIAALGDEYARELAEKEADRG